MEIGEWPASVDLNDIYREIRAAGLEPNVAELEAYGLTVVPPDRAAPAGLADRLVEAVLAVAERRTGRRPDPDTGTKPAEYTGPVGLQLHYLLYEDPAFEAALMNDVALSLISYLLGKSCQLSSMTALLKGAGETSFHLHNDSTFMPDPLPAYASVANATYVLTDYGTDDGGLCFVPGSHRFCRQPTPAEARWSDAVPATQLPTSTRLGAMPTPDDPPSALVVPVEAPKGSLIVWHGNTWHAGQRRRRSGLCRCR